MCACLPRAARGRYRLHSLTWAFQLMSWRSLGCCASRSGQGRLPLAGERSAQAPAPSARRAGCCPVCVMPLWRRHSPREYSEGVRPREFMRCLGGSKRGRSPRAALGVTATVHGTPRRACNASTTGQSRQVGPCARRSWSRRWRRAVWAVTARTESWKTRGGGGPDDLAQPAQVRRAPRGPTGRPAILPQEQGFEAALGRLQIVERLFPRAAQVTKSCVVDRGDLDGREGPCAPQARHVDGITTIRFDTGADLRRDQGRGDAPAAGACSGQRAIEPRAAGAGCRDKDALLARGLQGPDERVASPLPGPDHAERRLPRPTLGRQRRPRWTLDGHSCRRRACETAPWLTSERVGWLVQPQVVLMCRTLTRMQSGGNLPLSEVIMSRLPPQPGRRKKGATISMQRSILRRRGPHWPQRAR
jgi:hypothetical protein